MYHKAKKFQPLLKYVATNEGKAILQDIQIGVCGNYFTGQSLDNRAMPHRHWWSYMKEHNKDIAYKYEAYHKYENFINLPTSKLHPILYPWNFAQWGLDIIGPLPKLYERK